MLFLPCNVHTCNFESSEQSNFKKNKIQNTINFFYKKNTPPLNLRECTKALSYFKNFEKHFLSLISAGNEL